MPSTKIVKPFICSSAELVHKMYRLQFRRLLQWLISGGCQEYVLVANMVLFFLICSVALSSVVGIILVFVVWIDVLCRHYTHSSTSHYYVIMKTVKLLSVSACYSRAVKIFCPSSFFFVQPWEVIKIYNKTQATIPLQTLKPISLDFKGNF